MSIARQAAAGARFLRRFGHDRRGVAALTFAICAMVLLGVTFAAIDAARFSAARVELQDTLDSAIIAAGVTNATDSTTLNKVGGAYMTGQLKASPNLLNPKVTFTPGARSVSAVATADVDPIFMDLFTHSLVHLEAHSEVVRAQDQTLELAMVLDTTGSMAGTKISTLKTAATSLITKVMNGNTAGEARIGIVPFAQYVNMGVASRYETWANVPADGTTSTTTVKFSGCYGSPPYPQNVRDSDIGRKYPGMMNKTCSAQVTPLSTNAATLKAAITAVSASGNTYIPAGLAWGFNMLSPQTPLTDAAAYDTTAPNRKPRKVLLLMTDGANTKLMRPANNGDHEGNPVAGARAVQADIWTTELCNNIKAQKIEVYAVAFDIGSDTVSRELVRKCATDDAHFYDAADSAALIAAFGAIGASLQTLRISK